MEWKWYPETPEEKAEYQRMQGEWQKYQQEQNERLGVKGPVRSPALRRLKGLSVLLVLFFCAWIVGIVSSVAKPVPLNASDYIQRTKLISESLNAFHLELNEDFVDDGVVEYDVYEQDVKNILAEINELKACVLFSLGDFHEYQVVCEVYYGYVYDFWLSVKTKGEICADEFVFYGLALQRMQNPHDCLKSILEEHNYYHNVDGDGVIHYKTYNQPSMMF